MSNWAVAVALLPLIAAAPADYVVVERGRVEVRAAKAEDDSRILYLNRCAGGATVRSGADDARTDQSSLVDGPVRLPAFPFSDATWDDTVTRARTILAPFDVFVTDIDPGLVDHDEVFVCGDPSLLGGGSDLGGLAPFTCDGPIRNAVTFVFAAAIGDRPQVLAETIAHEAAHAWGLDHALLCSDAMSYLDCGAKTFVDAAVPCGETSARACTCDRLAQNSAAHLLALFGPGPGEAPAPPSGGCAAAPGGRRGTEALCLALALLASRYRRRRARGMRSGPPRRAAGRR